MAPSSVAALYERRSFAIVAAYRVRGPSVRPTWRANLPVSHIPFPAVGRDATCPDIRCRGEPRPSGQPSFPLGGSGFLPRTPSGLHDHRPPTALLPYVKERRQSPRHRPPGPPLFNAKPLGGSGFLPRTPSGPHDRWPYRCPRRSPRLAELFRPSRGPPPSSLLHFSNNHPDYTQSHINRQHISNRGSPDSRIASPSTLPPVYPELVEGSSVEG